MSYQLTTRNDEITVSLQNNVLSATIDGQTYTSTISNIGAQGPAGRSVVSASLNGSNELIFTMSDGSTINVGDLPTAMGLKPIATTASLTDIETGTLSTGLIQGGIF